MIECLIDKTEYQNQASVKHDQLHVLQLDFFDDVWVILRAVIGWVFVVVIVFTFFASAHTAKQEKYQANTETDTKDNTNNNTSDCTVA